MRLDVGPVEIGIDPSERAEDTVAMAKIPFGAEFVESNAVMTSIANCNSSLVRDRTMLDAAMVYASADQDMRHTPLYDRVSSP